MENQTHSNSVLISLENPSTIKNKTNIRVGNFLRNIIQCRDCTHSPSSSIIDADSSSDTMKPSYGSCSITNQPIKKFNVFACRYSTEGCVETLHGFNDHENYCPYRIFDCPIVAEDDFKGSLQHLREHLTTEHPNVFVNLRETTFANINKNGEVTRERKFLRLQDNIFTIDFCVSNNNTCLVNVMEINNQKSKMKFKVIFEGDPHNFFVDKRLITNVLFPKYYEYNLSELFDLFDTQTLTCRILIDLCNGI